MVTKDLTTQEVKTVCREEEYTKIIRGIEENPGIADLMRIYNEYQKIIKSSNKYLQQMQSKFVFSTTNSSE